MKSVLSGIALIGTAILAGRRRSGLSGLGLVNADHMDDVMRSLLKFNDLMAKATYDFSSHKSCKKKFWAINHTGIELQRAITSYESILGGDRESIEFLSKWDREISDANKRYAYFKQRFIDTCLEE